MNGNQLFDWSEQGKGMLPYARLLAFCVVTLGLSPSQVWSSPVREILMLARALAQAKPNIRPDRSSLEGLMRRFPDAEAEEMDNEQERRTG